MPNEIRITGPDITYWCCPGCGARFYRTATWESNTNHICPANPGAITICNKPKTNNKEGLKNE